MKLLITGGAGFIGSEIIRQLSDGESGYEIVVLDSLEEQIHGENPEQSYLYSLIQGKCEFVRGDIKDLNDVRKALNGVDVILHLAADTGTGQSMYQINQYNETNIMGTSNLFQAISMDRSVVKKIILASSRSVYGEGRYKCKQHGFVYPKGRKAADMKSGDFTVHCPLCNQPAQLVATTEESRITPNSLYAFTKLAQEKMVETMCTAMDIDYTIFRFQNVYGAGQSLKNPYTGILSIFSTLLLEDKPVNIFEDGQECRDFINVKDVAWAVIQSINNEASNGEVINIGSGIGTSVTEVAEKLKQKYVSNSVIHITGDFRIGDIANNIADISRAKRVLGFSPKISFDEGLMCFAEWVLTQQMDHGGYEASIKEMENNGMFIRKS